MEKAQKDVPVLVLRYTARDRLDVRLSALLASFVQSMTRTTVSAAALAGESLSGTLNDTKALTEVAMA